jgi:hypothetical protein
MKLTLEQLEDRALLSVFLTHGILHVANDNAVPSINAGVDQLNARIVRVQWVEGPDFSVHHVAYFPASQVHLVEFDGGSDWNLFFNNTAIDDVMYGASVGHANNGHDDVLVGGYGHSTVYQGAQNCTVTFRGTRAEFFHSTSPEDVYAHIDSTDGGVNVFHANDNTLIWGYHPGMDVIDSTDGYPGLVTTQHLNNYYG